MPLGIIIGQIAVGVRRTGRSRGWDGAGGVLEGRCRPAAGKLENGGQLLQRQVQLHYAQDPAGDVHGAERQDSLLLRGGQEVQ